MQGRPILVVDDDETLRTLLADVLAFEGYPVEIAADGMVALDVMEHVRPSLVLTDVHMPNLDGPGFVQALHERGFDPPILVLSGTVREAWEVMNAMRVDACLLKPFNLEALLIAVEHLRIP